ncbi:MAG: PQQ-binding-like beta-propeller repeat protein [Mycobacteriales bacterium]
MCTEDHAIPRRRFLSGIGLGTALAGTGGLALPSVAGATTSDGVPAGQGFALVADTHLNPAVPVRTSRMTQVFAAILARDPAVVLHCGDITDTGFVEEFALYESTVPAALAARIHYTPGNHELRWDAAAGETFRRFCGPKPSSFDAAGLHFVALDPAMLLQEPAHFGGALLDWLERDLARVPSGRPIALFQHHPIGDQWFFDDDQDRFLSLTARYDVRALFAGHLHRQFVSAMNGLVEVTLNAVINTATYYWAQPAASADGRSVLEVTRVDLAADGTPTTTPIVTIPLAGPRIARAARPVSISTGAATRGAVPVTVRTAGVATSVGAQVLSDVVWSGSLTIPFEPLEPDGHGTTWRGTVDVSTRFPGAQGIRVRSTDDTGFWDDYRTISLPTRAGDPRQRWQLDLGEGVQAGLAVAGNTVVASTTGGTVTAIELSDGRGRLRWQRRVGPIYREAAINDELAMVPSTDHSLTAFDVAGGRTRWRADLGAPLLGSALATGVDGTAVVIATAGTTATALDAATGKSLWRSDIGGFCAGRAACDGTLVYLGSGDGRTHALDARTGAPVWQFANRADTTDPHVLLLYGPWDDRVQLAGTDVVLSCTVSATWGLSRADGTARWSVPGSCMYSTPRLTILGGTPCALLVQERGLTRLVEVETGTIRWEAQLGWPCFNSGAIIVGGTAWIAGVNGHLGAVDLATGAIGPIVRLSTAYTYSEPVVVHDQVVIADQSGTVRGVTVP